MRDLASKLRAIVRQPSAPSPVRELTYVPEAGGVSMDVEAAAAALGGVAAGAGSCRFVSIDHVWDGQAWHGRRRVASFVPDPDAPLRLFEPHAAGWPDWARRPVFFDIETTGLSGGAGTLAFLAGCGWFEEDGFRVRQFFLAGPAGETAMLDALAALFDEASLLVTYNGRTFDVPTMETRWAFHRRASATEDVAHLDMLPIARRLWGRRRPAGAPPVQSPWADPVDDDGRCRLSALERTVLGFHRIGDVAGIEIPVRYFHYLRTGDAAAIAGVLEHNRHDLLSLAAVTARALELGRDGPEACAGAGEQLGLGGVYERAGEPERAARAYELAAASGDRQVRSRALGRLAVLLRRDGRFDEAAEAWRGVMRAEAAAGALTPLGRRAAEALAVHHEHRARDLAAARGWAARLSGTASGRAAADARHRLNRLDRKIEAENTTGGPEAARLFEPES